MSHGEVAIIQNMSEGTIAWRMHEARRRLTAIMSPERMPRPKLRELSADLSRALNEYGLFVPAFDKP
ncbi:MAG: hypothetical protein NT062_03210 [Proteobacteria bacterium]|nr:hypothetical protein [Pseudomonadota bacterium]